MKKVENTNQTKIDKIQPKNEDILNEEISASQICNSFEQDARRYKKFLGDDEKMMYK